MADIFIDLDNAVYSPTVDLTLLDIVKRLDSCWCEKATCITQESDGDVWYWDAPVEEVILARSKADLDTGLMPLVGFKSLVRNVYFEIDEESFVAKDWKTAVVTKEAFLAHTTVIKIDTDKEGYDASKTRI